MEPAASHTQKRPLRAITSLAVVALRKPTPSSTRLPSRARAQATPVRRRRLGSFVPAGLCVALALAVVFSVTTATASAAPPREAFVVDMTADAADVNPGDGICSTGNWSGNKCSLRAAILEANALPGHDTITFEVPGPSHSGFRCSTTTRPRRATSTSWIPVTIYGNVLLGTIIDGGFAAGEQRRCDRHGSTLRDPPQCAERDVRGHDPSRGVGRRRRRGDPELVVGPDHASSGSSPEEPGRRSRRDQQRRPVRLRLAAHGSAPDAAARAASRSSTRSSSTTARAPAVQRSTMPRRGYISILNSDIVDNPGPMIPDPLDPEEMIPAPGILPPDSSPVVNEGQFDGIGTIHDRRLPLRPQLLRARRRRDRERRRRHPDHRGSELTDNTSEAAGGAVSPTAAS